MTKGMLGRALELALVSAPREVLLNGLKKRASNKKRLEAGAISIKRSRSKKKKKSSYRLLHPLSILPFSRVKRSHVVKRFIKKTLAPIEELLMKRNKEPELFLEEPELC